MFTGFPGLERSQGASQNSFYDAIRRRLLSKEELVHEIGKGMEKLAERQPEIDYQNFPIGDQKTELTSEMLVPETTVGFGGPLSSKGILRHLFLGDIEIYPFKPENLGVDGYDVTLGSWYYRFKNTLYEGEKKAFLHNPYSKLHAGEVWSGPIRAEPLRKLKLPNVEGIGTNDSVILLDPGEMILGHTDEVLFNANVVATVSARSSVGRNLITVCEDSFTVHHRFKGRIALEIRSKTKKGWSIPLVAGRRYAQLQFSIIENPLEHKSGRYDEGRDVVDIYRNWDPAQMLPQMWKDREVEP